MLKCFILAASVLAGSAALAQPASDKTTTAPAPTGSQTREVPPPPGGAAIPSDLRSKATKDIPMGNGKPKSSEPSGSTDKRGK